MWWDMDDERCDLPPEGRFFLLWVILFNVLLLICAVMNTVC